MSAMTDDIFAAARKNEAFRRVVATGEYSQVVLMTIPPGEEIGEEVHDDVDQTLLIIDGEGAAVLEGQSTPIRPGSLTFVPAGTKHNFVNQGAVALRLCTVYGPPEHPDGTVHETKAEADAAEHH